MREKRKSAGQVQEGIRQAVILADRENAGAASGVPLLRVATLSVALRAILAAQRAGAKKFLVVIDAVTGPGIRRALEQSTRLPEAVEWFTVPEHTSLPAVLGEIAERTEDWFLLLRGDRLFYPGLLDKLRTASGKGVLALTSSARPSGIFQFSRQTAREIAAQAPAEINTLDELYAWLTRTPWLDCKSVDGQLWHPLSGPDDLPVAERRLDRWLFKETDNIFARANRRISIPISRLLIRTPVTPNQVTLATLAVSIVSGVFFALGGYRNALVGAVLSLWASILDGSDGEVARLTFQESDRGCWLEMVCDYLYYLFVFSGMVIGMYRTSGSVVYPITGGIFIFGSLMSLLTTSYQRKHFTQNQPEKYGAKWERKMEAHRDDFFFRFAKRYHFLARRSTLPYAILAFAVIDFMDFVLFMSTFGANLIWTITLYSNRVFRRDPAPETVPPSEMN